MGKKINVSVLAEQAKAGNQKALVELWEHVKPLCMKLCKRYLNMLYQSGYEDSDIAQEHFCAVWEAVRHYDSGRGSFNTLLGFYVQNQCRKALHIRNGQNIAQLLNAQSLDNTLKEDGDTTHMEMIPDSTATEAMYAVLDNYDNDLLRKDIETVLARLAPKYSAVIRGRFYQNKTRAKLAEELSLTEWEVIYTERRAVKRLRDDRTIWKHRNEYISVNALRGTSLRSWKYGGGSVQERIIEQLEHDGLL